MTPRFLRRSLLVSLVLASGCAAFPPDHVLIVTAGSSICSAPRNGECERLQRIGDTLNTGALAKAIEEARLK